MLTHKRLTRYKLDLFPFDVFCEILMSCGRQEEVTLPKCEAVAHFSAKGPLSPLVRDNPADTKSNIILSYRHQDIQDYIFISQTFYFEWKLLLRLTIISHLQLKSLLCLYESNFRESFIYDANNAYV